MTAPAAVPFVIGVRCTTCSRFSNPRAMVHLPEPSNVHLCQNCYAHHVEALHALNTGTPPRACQVCGTTYDQLQGHSPHGNTAVSMYLHQKDGVYQLLCPTCSDQYERKRLDLYGDTPYGWLKKLKGAK